MDTAAHPSIQFFIDRFDADPELHALCAQLLALSPGNPQNDIIEELIQLYHRVLPLLEKAIWSVGPDAQSISQYQSVFREMERLIELKGEDPRHSFIIVIPVADRPRHLSHCLDSLHTLCKLYEYGGHNGTSYNKIHVIIADDSREHSNIELNKSICAEYNERGLTTEYFGANKQIELIKNITNPGQTSLDRILGDYARRPEPTNFYHKGASITRNIAYLRINQVVKDNTNQSYLVYFIDSDQEFRIKIPGGDRYIDIYAINYFYQLNEIFTHTEAQILTGKVVGDPPVSPSVMAANFLDDVIGFLKQTSTVSPTQSCCFHTPIEDIKDDAAYHDMASLFGFNPLEGPAEYHCSLQHDHDNAACFADFASKLNRFFDGEHPTRVTCFNYEKGFSTTTPARTVYTGNYVFKPKHLEYFIAFATLKLRMAGPTLGRIIKSEIHDSFVSANLPMLHKRTIQNTGESECRPGVKRESDAVDLSGEFERQFYGDIMLFTIDKLTRLGYPGTLIPVETIVDLLDQTIDEIQHQYNIKHKLVMDKLSNLESIYSDRTNWWHCNNLLEQAQADFIQFMHNIEHNFSDTSSSYTSIISQSNREIRRSDILLAIMKYADDRAVWNKLLQ